LYAGFGRLFPYLRGEAWQKAVFHQFIEAGIEANNEGAIYALASIYAEAKKEMGAEGKAETVSETKGEAPTSVKPFIYNVAQVIEDFVPQISLIGKHIAAHFDDPHSFTPHKAAFHYLALGTAFSGISRSG